MDVLEKKILNEIEILKKANGHDEKILQSLAKIEIALTG